MKTNQLIKWGSALLLLAILLLVAGRKAGWIGGQKPEEVSIEHASLRNITESITANGRIEPETEVKISPDVSGEVVELWVKEGQDVKRGDLLLKIRPDSYQSALERATAGLNQAQSNLANARARHAQTVAQFKQSELSYARSKNLFEQKTISTADFETAQTNFEVAKSEVQASEQNVLAALYQSRSAEAALKEARENLLRTSIFAPMDGTISRLNVEKGERVVGTMQMAGTELLRVANLDRMQLTVDVNENDILKLSLGDTANIEIDAYTDATFMGLVTEIANSASATTMSSDQATDFEVKILLLPESYADIRSQRRFPFRPGMSATADIRTESRYQVLTVPIQAVTTRPDTTQSKPPRTKPTASSTPNDTETSTLREVVFVQHQGKADLRYIETGIQDNDYIEIRSGLKASEAVIVGPYRLVSKKLEHGSPVRPSTKPTQAKEE